MSETKFSPGPCALKVDPCAADAALIAAAPDLYEALTAIGGMPDGDCFCFNSVRDPKKPEHEHTGECRVARSALSRARGESTT